MPYSSLNQTISMCLGSRAGCEFREDSQAPNGYGWCDFKNDPFQVTNLCGVDCSQCFNQDECKNIGPDCTWDPNFMFCKNKNFGDSEICFDGIDNNNNGLIDCDEPSCMFDPFCSGNFGSNCLNLENTTCLARNDSCVWFYNPESNEFACDVKGADCWTYDQNESACTSTGYCEYINLSMETGSNCDINHTLLPPKGGSQMGCKVFNNQSACQSNINCTWMIDPMGNGICDNKIFICWVFQNESACENSNATLGGNYCSWHTDPLYPEMGWCDSACFGANTTECSANPICEPMQKQQICVPKMKFDDCWSLNQSDCLQQNDTCVLVSDFSGEFCADRATQSFVDDVDRSPPLVLLSRNVSSDSHSQSKIKYIGIKDSDESLAFAVGVIAMNNTAVCNKFYNPSQNLSASFYVYLDMDGNNTNNCEVNTTDGSIIGGFETKLVYESWVENGKFKERKRVYTCSNSSEWQIRNIKLGIWPDGMCSEMINGGVLVLAREGLAILRNQSFFDPDRPLRIFATTGFDENNNTYRSDNPYDEIGPVYYKKGSADFKPEVCSGNKDVDGDGLLPTEDPDCFEYFRVKKKFEQMNINIPGFMYSERGTDCDDGIDNDMDNLIDCADPGCMNYPYYCNLTNITEDREAPAVNFFQMHTFLKGAVFDITTDEPSRGKVLFFNNDSFCLDTSLVATILDPKLYNNLTSDDYDLWHTLHCDQRIFEERGLSFNFTQNTTYYYRTELCDEQGNCALSACSSFKTATRGKNITVGFDMPGNSNSTYLTGYVFASYDTNGDGNYDGNITRGSGSRVPEDDAFDIGLRFNNPHASKQWSINFRGVDFKRDLDLDLNDAFIVNETANGSVMVGLKKEKWNEMAQKLGVDYVRIVIPQGVSDSDLGRLRHCPDNATSPDDPRCLNISMSDVSCTFTTNMTICDIPTSIGFSVFAVYMAEAVQNTGTGGGTTEETQSSSGGGSGGGTLSSATKGNVVKSLFKVEAGVIKELKINSEDLPLTNVKFGVKSD
jgi:hypothetical protein